MDGAGLLRLLQPFHAIGGGFGPIPPGGDQLGKPGALVIFIFDDQYFFVVHSMVCVVFACHMRLQDSDTNDTREAP